MIEDKRGMWWTDLSRGVTNDVLKQEMQLAHLNSRPAQLSPGVVLSLLAEIEFYKEKYVAGKDARDESFDLGYEEGHADGYREAVEAAGKAATVGAAKVAV